jgi:hypothetical protein
VKSGDKPAAVQSVFFSASKILFIDLINNRYLENLSETHAICGLGLKQDRPRCAVKSGDIPAAVQSVFFILIDNLMYMAD